MSLKFALKSNIPVKHVLQTRHYSGGERVREGFAGGNQVRKQAKQKVRKQAKQNSELYFLTFQPHGL